MDLETKERQKYERVWNDPFYTESESMGLKIIRRFPTIRTFEKFGCKTILDAGCGNAQFVDLINDGNFSFSVEGCDLVPVPERDEIYYCCLWNDDIRKTYDGIFCTDVLEHIPTSKIDTVIKNLADHCSKVAVFGICLQQDNYGKETGEFLHLTVRPVTWWLNKLDEHFTIDAVVACSVWLNVGCLKEGMDALNF